MKAWKLLLFCITLLLLDVATKAYVHSHVPFLGWGSSQYPYGGIGVFQGVCGGIDFSINHVLNRGAVWGVLSAYHTLLLAIRLVLIAALVGYLALWNQVSARRLPLSLVIVGALGNVLDFFLYGHVIDFLHLRFWGYSYPLFNVADSAIFCGVAWLILQSMRKGKKESHAP